MEIWRKPCSPDNDFFDYNKCGDIGFFSNLLNVKLPHIIIIHVHFIDNCTPWFYFFSEEKLFNYLILFSNLFLFSIYLLRRILFICTRIWFGFETIQMNNFLNACFLELFIKEKRLGLQTFSEINPIFVGQNCL